MSRRPVAISQADINRVVKAARKENEMEWYHWLMIGLFLGASAGFIIASMMLMARDN